MSKILVSTMVAGLACGSAYGQIVQSGQYAAQVTNSVSGAWVGDTGFDRGNNLVAVTPGTTVRLVFFAKSAHLTPSTMERATVVFFSGKDASGNATGHLGDFNTAVGTPIGRTWTRFSYDVAVPATAAWAGVSFRIAAGGNPSHSLQIDNISLVNTADLAVNLLSNPDLETWTGSATEAPNDWRFFAVAGATGSIKRLEQMPAFSAEHPVLEQIFKADAHTSTTAGPLPWFSADSPDWHTVRGLTYNPHTGHLLVTDREAITGNNNLSKAIYILDANTGAQLGTLNTTGMDIGVFHINKVVVDGSGRIFVANLTTSATNSGDFRVYMYPSEASAQTTPATVVYSAPTGLFRLGDDLAVTGSGPSTRILVASRNTADILQLEDPDNNGQFTLTAAPTPHLGAGGPGNVAFDTDPSRYWFHQSTTGAPRQVDYELLPYNWGTGTPAADPAPTNTGYMTGPFAVAQIAGRKLVALSPAETEHGIPTYSNIRGLLYTAEGSILTPAYRTAPLEKANMTWFSTNGNGAGDVAFDVTGQRVFFLFPNHSISGWKVPAPPTAAVDWQIFE